MASRQDIELVYDAQCPICRNYSNRVRLADDRLNLVLVDARRPGRTVRDLMARGLDVDEGMAVIIDGTPYHGSRAIHELARIADPTGPFGTLNRLLFGSRRVARFTYPFAKLARNVVLRLIGVDRIRHAIPADTGDARQAPG